MQRADDGTFRNPWRSYIEYSPWDFLTRVLPKVRPTHVRPLPAVPPRGVLRDGAPTPTELQTTWMGHASFLIQARGFNVLTDPALSLYASPVQFAGPKRYSPAAMPIEALPRVHLLLISHNHYDHIDADSVRSLVRKDAADAAACRDGSYTGNLWVCPLRVGALLHQLGVAKTRIVELDWWQTFTPAVDEAGAIVPDARAGRIEALPRVAEHPDPLPLLSRRVPVVTCTPAQHQSARTLWDRNKTLWCGFHLRVGSPGVPDVSAYFTGDTGYRSVLPGVEPLSAEEAASPACPAFAEIGQRFNGVDLCLLPIGAYSPRWFMSSFHASPEDAVDMHVDLRSRMSIGMHWATFPLTDEPIMEPPQRLARALAHKRVDASRFVAVWPGSTVVAVPDTLRGPTEPAVQLTPTDGTVPSVEAK